MQNAVMDQWYVSRWMRSVSLHDFEEAVRSMRRHLKVLTKRDYDLRVDFYKAAKPQAGEPLRKPDILIESVPGQKLFSPQLWRKSDYVEAVFSVQGTCDELREESESDSTPACFNEVRIGAKWPDRRRIEFEVKPDDDSSTLCRDYLGSNFIFWSRGLG